ncbi:MAG TPA: GNAT family N-acetyltransferase [Candidatus Saccharimonadales bacterium]|nr:GNAT family N-acetyltransferase [Candidatus Saccharimonadales bacterium]
MSSIEVVPFVPDFDSPYCRQAYDLIKHEIFPGDKDFPSFSIQTLIMREQCGTLYGIIPEHRQSLIAVGALDKKVVEGYREVAYLAVAPESRKHGYGRYLLGLLEKIAAQEGADGACLIPNASAVKFYEKRGYREWIDPPVVDGVVNDYWRKQFGDTAWAK